MAIAEHTDQLARDVVAACNNKLVSTRTAVVFMPVKAVMTAAIATYLDPAQKLSPQYDPTTVRICNSRCS